MKQTGKSLKMDLLHTNELTVDTSTALGQVDMPIGIRGVKNINMSKFCLADYLNPFSLLSCSQKYQNFLFRIMGSASSGIGYFGQKLSF